MTLIDIPSSRTGTVSYDSALRLRIVILGVLLGLAAFQANGQTATKTQRLIGDVTPESEWQQVSPESVGYSFAKLEALRGWVKTQDTTSMVVIVQGRVIFSYGDISHTSEVASVRKSILGMLYGNYVFSGKIDTSKTVKQLGLDDKQPFLPIEEHATLEHLLTSRSGIYLPAGSFGQEDYMPKRGSEYPGTHFVYNNWDFNAAGVAFEKLTGRDIYQALQDDLADPIGMQDYVVSRQKKQYNPESLHPEYAMVLSSRDMGRLGLLMLNHGVWNGSQLIPSDWIRYMTGVITPFRDINPTFGRNYGEPERWGYGALWWVWDQPLFPGGIQMGFLQGAYTAMGTGGTFITVLPAKDMVVVHQVDIDKNPRGEVSPSSYIAMLSMIANSYCDQACQ
ncbi:MAG: serine hydrolase [Acidobacteriales bacterium]|nr:serine hydrolase [Terriglobales bacterium]